MTETAQHLSRNANWQTPPEIIEPAKLVLGTFDLDPASNARANQDIGARKIFTIDDDALSQEWSGRVWLNPPGDKSGRLVRRFWDKLLRSYIDGGVSEAIWLGFSLEQLVSLQNQKVTRSPLHFPVCVPRKRIQFIDEHGSRRASTGKDGKKRAAPTHGNYLVYLGARTRVFWDVFSEHVGAVR